MDSPEISKIKTNTASSSDSPPVQDSPVFSYINSLSPIKPVKATHAAQGFAGLNSPPLVFTSPRINSHREASFLKRPQYAQLFSAEKPKTQDEARKHITQSHMELITDTQAHDAKIYGESQRCSSSEGVDEYLVDPTEVECMCSAQSVNPCSKENDNTADQLIVSKEITFDNKNGTGTDSEMGAEPPIITSEQDEGFERMQASDAKPVKMQGQTDDELPLHDCQNVHSVGNADEREYHQDFHDQAMSDQCGMHPRCLQFEEAPPVTGKGESSLDPGEKVNLSEPQPGTAELKMVKSSYADLKAICKRQMCTSLPPRSPLSVSKPSGIGLHLNSIVKVAPVVHGSITSIKLADNYVGVKVMKSASGMSCHLPENVMCCPTLLNEVEKDSAGAEERNEIETSVSASSAITQSPHTVEFDNCGPPLEKRKFYSQSVDSYNEFSESIPKQKRKKTSRSKESDGCKRCNCKRSKCLKLYCDCFAAGVYCVDSCSCQGCYNKPEYEDTVLETRQQIESRNPLAFAPKIVQNEEIQFTPSSARHTRGCSCRKSMCQKKYCECYQANVGCSIGCRCEGCKNVYGRKGDKVSEASKESLESTFEEKLEMVATKKDTLTTELYISNNLTPLTPSLQCSDHANNAPTSLCLPTTYDPSPESALTNISSFEKSTRYPLGKSESGDISLESGPTTCHITPMSMAMASSTSSRRSDLTHMADVQLFPGSQGLSSGSSLHWRTSPVTPMTPLGATKSFQGLDSENGLYDVLQDDTPEVLKDTSTPTRMVKVSSPNKKRVSPPHSHIHALGAGSSGALRSGRKFILKAVPSFPPLTPCVDTKGSSVAQNTSNLQDKGLSK